MYPQHVTLIKSFTIETFLGLNSPLGRLFVVHLGVVNNFMVKTANVVNSFTITAGKQMPFTDTKTAVGWLRHSAFANRTFIPAGRMSCGLHCFQKKSCPWYVSEHILDPLDLQYPSWRQDNPVFSIQQNITAIFAREGRILVIIVEV
jgi:hypothetical protein